MAKFFDDIGKDSADLLSKDFPASGTAQVSVETKNDSGVTLLVTGKRFIKGKDSLIEAQFEPTFDWAEKNLEIKGSLSTNGEYKDTVTLKDLGTKGTKLSAGFTHKPAGGIVTGGFSFKNDVVAVKLGGGYPIKKESGPNVEGSLVAAYEKKIFAGLSSTYALEGEKDPSAFTYAAKVGFDQPEFQGHISARSAIKDKKDQLLLGAGWYHKLSDVLRLGAAATFDAKNVAGPSVQVAADYKFDALTSLKAKLGFQAYPDGAKPADLRLGFGLKQYFTKSATVTFGADLNGRTLAGQNSGDEHSFGVDLKFQ